MISPLTLLRRNIYGCTVACLSLIALLLRLYQLDAQSLWNDEMFTMQVAGLPFGGIRECLSVSYHHPPLFFYATAAVIRWLGTSAWSLRLLPALCGAATVPLLAVLGDRLYRRPAGLLAGLICLVSPFHLAYSQEARPYALAGFLALLSAGLFLLLRRRWSTSSAVGLLLADIALLYSHHWGIFVVAAEALIAFLVPSGEPKFRNRFALLLTGTVLLYLPGISLAAHQAGTGMHDGWTWVDPPGPMNLINTFRAFSGSYFRMATSVFMTGGPIGTVAMGSLLILLGTAILPLLRGQAAYLVPGALLLLLILLLPFGVSFFRPEIFVWFRYTFIAFPLFCLLLGAIAAEARSPGAAAASLFVFLLTEGFGTTIYFSGWSKSNVQEVCDYVASTAPPETDFIIRPASFAPLFGYYYRGRIPQTDEAYLDQPLGEVVDTARSFVYVSLDVPNPIRDYMNGHFRIVARRLFPGEAHLGWWVCIYAQPPDSD